jgi:hypothetical protein
MYRGTGNIDVCQATPDRKDDLDDILTQQLDDEGSYPSLSLPDDRLKVTLPDVSVVVSG